MILSNAMANGAALHTNDSHSEIAPPSDESRPRAVGTDPAAIVASVREIVRAGTVTPNPASVARALCMSTRTLQRRLFEASRSLSDIVDEVRRDAAFERLLSGVPIAKVSVLLGFSESRAFFRAFRRWTGTTPRRWRATAMASGVSAPANASNSDCPVRRTDGATLLPST